MSTKGSCGKNNDNDHVWLHLEKWKDYYMEHYTNRRKDEAGSLKDRILDGNREETM